MTDTTTDERAAALAEIHLDVTKRLTRWMNGKLQDPLPDWGSLPLPTQLAYLHQADEVMPIIEAQYHLLIKARRAMLLCTVQKIPQGFNTNEQLAAISWAFKQVEKELRNTIIALTEATSSENGGA